MFGDKSAPKSARARFCVSICSHLRACAGVRVCKWSARARVCVCVCVCVLSRAHLLQDVLPCSLAAAATSRQLCCAARRPCARPQAALLRRHVYSALCRPPPGFLFTCSAFPFGLPFSAVGFACWLYKPSQVFLSILNFETFLWIPWITLAPSLWVGDASQFCSSAIFFACCCCAL